MANNRYSEEFKLKVVNEYFDGELGVRLLATKYNLPSKNYITRWINEMKKTGKIPAEKSVSRSARAEHSKRSKSMIKSPYEEELEKKVLTLEAELALVNEYKKLVKNSKKK